jgi:hypothetical protein
MNYADELARLIQLQADRAELKLARERGEVISIAAETQADIAMITTIKNRLLGVPSKNATRMVGKSDARRGEMLTKEINECLSEWRPELLPRESPATRTCFVGDEKRARNAVDLPSDYLR